MINSFDDKRLERWYRSADEHDEMPGSLPKGMPANVRKRLFRKVQLLDMATSDKDLRSPPGNRLEKLSGKLSDCHSIRVNDMWRLILEWDADKGIVSRLRLDPHEYGT